MIYYVAIYFKINSFKMSVLFIQNLSVYQSFIMLFVILTKQKQSLKKNTTEVI